MIRVGVAEDPRARLVFSGRDPRAPGQGNVSLEVGPGDPLAQRAAVLAAVGLEPTDAVYMQQVHGGRVAVVGREHRGRGCADHADAIDGADALITRAPDVALAVMVADCVPLVLVHPGEAVGAVHAGRRGIEAGVVTAALRAFGADRAGRLAAVIGPAIGPCCYEVPQDLARSFSRSVGGVVGRTRWGTPSLDLSGSVAAQLDAAGIGRIERVGGCTRCAGDRYFSHRAAPGVGRQMAVVCRRVAPPRSVPERSLDYER